MQVQQEGRLDGQSAWFQAETPGLEKTTPLVVAWPPSPRKPEVEGREGSC